MGLRPKNQQTPGGLAKWILVEEAEPPPRPADVAAAEDRRQLEKISDYLCAKYPETRGMDLDEAVLRVIEEERTEVGRLKILLEDFRKGAEATSEDTSALSDVHQYAIAVLSFCISQLKRGELKRSRSVLARPIDAYRVQVDEIVTALQDGKNLTRSDLEEFIKVSAVMAGHLIERSPSTSSSSVRVEATTEPKEATEKPAKVVEMEAKLAKAARSFVEQVNRANGSPSFDVPELFQLLGARQKR
jgi:hypothetical protein